MSLHSKTHPANNFDFIRIVAASMVMFSHHFALTGQFEPSFFRFASIGGTAVTIFFIISGYLVTQSWYRDPHVLRFASRRILRIWPALTCAVLLTAFVLGPAVSSLPLDAYLQHGATWDYLRTLYLHVHYVLPGVFEHNPFAATVNGSLWTIPYEVRCYAVLGLAGLVGLLKSRRVFLLCIGIYLAWFLTKSNADVLGTTRYGPQLSAFFLLGGAMAVLEPAWRSRTMVWYAVIGVAFAALWSVGWRHTAMLFALPLLIIHLGTLRTPVIHRAGRFGDPSYGIYLFAFPIQQWVILRLWPEAGFWGTLLATAAITVALAYASWHLLEKKALRLKPSYAGGPMLSRWIAYFRQSEAKSFLALFAFLFCCYGAWLVACWPGMLGEDSYALILEMETAREFQAGKPAFWYLFNYIFYGPTGRVEIPIAIQTLICVAVFARILAWLFVRRMHKSFWYCLLLIVLAPSMALYVSGMYSDGIFAVATAGMMFEIWRCIHRKAIDRTAVWMLLATIPFAVFARPNGIINLLPLAILGFTLARSQRIRLLLIAVPCLAVGFGSQMAYKYRNPIGTLFPLAVYETAGFLEHRPMKLWEFNEPRVTPRTVEALTSNGATLEKISEFYDHYYWDPLIFHQGGPGLLALPNKEKRAIIREFFKYNLWHNFPAFAASRVNIFLYSALARASTPGPLTASYVLPKTKSVSVSEAINLPTDKALNAWFQTSVKYRALLWAPWLGLFLIVVGARRCLHTRDTALRAVCGIYAAQLLAVFTFSIAGEYRYLLAFFTAPLVLLPVLYFRSGSQHV